MSLIIERGWKEINYELKRLPGQNHYKMVQNFEKLHLTTARNLNRIVFLKRCKKKSLIPDCVKCQLPPVKKPSAAAKMLKEKLEKRMLKDEIADAYKEVANSMETIHDIRNALISTVPHLYNEIETLIFHKRNKIFESNKSTHRQKLQKLMGRLEKEEHKTQTKILSKTPKCVENLSSRQLSKDELATLSLGLNFAVPDKNHNKMLLETAMYLEQIISEIDDDEIGEVEKNCVKSQVCKVLMSDYSQPDNSIEKVPKWIKSSITSLKQDKSIIIIKADKGNTTVILDRAEYESKMDVLISSGPYKEALKDPTTVHFESTKKLLQKLGDDNKISKPTMWNLKPFEEVCPRIYGVPKLHKENLPLRPIVDYRYSPCYKTSLFLKKIFKTLTDNHEHTLKNSYDFVERIKDKILDPMDVMISFDVVSLFTNVPITITIQIVKRKLETMSNWKRLAENLTTDDIMEMLKLCLENYFTWRGKFYIQIEGMPMGSPLSPVLAEIFLQEMERTLIPNQPDIKCWFRMVDDVFAIIRRRSHVKILKMLHDYPGGLTFTIDEGDIVNNSINFLDVTITKNGDGSLSRKVFRKETHSNRYLDWNSHHHRSQKISVIDSLVMRAIRICDSNSIDAELKFIERVLIGNGYPAHVLNRRIDYMKNRSNTTSSQNKDEKWCAIPFCGDVTYKVASIIRSGLNRNLGYYTGRKLSSFITNYKDKRNRVNAGIYKILCNCGAIYIGETKRDFRIRQKEHEADIRLGRIGPSPLAEHEHNNPGHTVQVGSIALIDKEPRYFQRKLKEGLHIKKAKRTQQTMNRNDGQDIGSQWLPFLFKLI